MYFGALIQLPDGTRKVIGKSGWGQLAIMKFMAAIGDYAKEENLLVKICCDDVKAVNILRKMLPDRTIEYGIEGMLELELKMHEKTKT